LWAKGLSAKDIHKEMFSVYDGKCLSRKVVHNWGSKYFAHDEEVETKARSGCDCDNSQKTSTMQVLMNW
jgi:hypothetical protein